MNNRHLLCQSQKDMHRLHIKQIVKKKLLRASVRVRASVRTYIHAQGDREMIRRAA